MLMMVGCRIVWFVHLFWNRQFTYKGDYPRNPPYNVLQPTNLIKFGILMVLG